MRIGIIGGTGPAGTGLAARLASVGYETVLGSRSASRAQEIRDALVERHPEIGDLLGCGDNATAAECELIVMATPWDSAAGIAHDLAPSLAGKVVISMANALIRAGGEFEPLIHAAVCPHTSRLPPPEDRVVAAFQHLPAKELGEIDQPIDSDVLICGDDRAAVEQVSEIIAKFPGCRPLDAGELSNAMAIEAFTAVMLQLNVRYKTRVAPKMTGIDRDPRAVDPGA